MKNTLSLFCVLCLLLALAGCVQTPEQPLVAQKDVDRLIEKAQQTPNGNALSDLAEKTPGDYQWQTTACQNRIRVTVDAEIILPERDAAPMYRVTAGALTDEQCRAITSYLYKDTLAYEMPQNRSVTLKADVDIDILIPWATISTTVEVDVLIAETVIVGRVPETYVSLMEGQHGSK